MYQTLLYAFYKSLVDPLSKKKNTETSASFIKIYLDKRISKNSSYASFSHNCLPATSYDSCRLAAAVDVSSAFFCFSCLVSVYGKDKYFAYFALVGALSLFLLLSISLKIRSKVLL